MTVNTSITNLTQQQQSLRLFRQQQADLATLQQQLATGTKSTDLSGYTPQDTRKLLDLRSSQSTLETYQQTITTLTPRITTQTNALSNMQTVLDNMRQLLTQASTPDSAATNSLSAQAANGLSQMQFLLNQKVDGRYLFSGSRYETVPVSNLQTLTSPPAEAYPFTPAPAPAAALYDTQIDAAHPADPVVGATDKDAVAIGDGLIMDYGMTSNEPAFQNMIQGLRYAQAAANDPVNYADYRQKAQALLTTATGQLRQLEAKAAGNAGLLKTTTDQHATAISILKSGQDAIDTVDGAEVAAKITTLTTQIQASYAATSKIMQLSIINYLN